MHDFEAILGNFNARVQNVFSKFLLSFSTGIDASTFSQIDIIHVFLFFQPVVFDYQKKLLLFTYSTI